MVSEVEPLPAEDIERFSEWKEKRYRELIADAWSLLRPGPYCIADRPVYPPAARP